MEISDNQHEFEFLLKISAWGDFEPFSEIQLKSMKINTNLIFVADLATGSF